VDQATIDNLKAVFTENDQPRVWYLVTPDGKRRISRAVVETIGKDLTCTLAPIDAAAKIPKEINAADLYETPEDALAAFDVQQAADRDKAVADVDSWSGGKIG